MKNILLMVPRMNIGGAETYTYQLAIFLKEQGHKVVIASGGGILATRLKAAGIPQVFLPMRFSTGLSAWLLRWTIKKYHIDLIHANSGAAGITAIKYKRKYNLEIPVIYTAHGNMNDRELSYVLDAEKIICVSKFLKDTFIDRGYPSEKFTTIYTGINTDIYSPYSVEGISRESLKIPAKAFTMILVARIKNMHNKGHQVMLDILSKYPDTADWHLIVVGKGRSLGKLKAEIYSLGLQDRVHCVGHQTDVASYVMPADVVVLPSVFETFGLALAEGMAMGKPGVAFKVGGCEEVIKDGETGFLVPYNDTAKFKEKLRYLASHKIECEAMGLTAREDINQRFQCSKMIELIEKLYKEV